MGAPFTTVGCLFIVLYCTTRRKAYMVLAIVFATAGLAVSLANFYATKEG